MQDFYNNWSQKLFLNQNDGKRERFQPIPKPALDTENASESLIFGLTSEGPYSLGLRGCHVR